MEDMGMNDESRKSACMNYKDERRLEEIKR